MEEIYIPQEESQLSRFILDGAPTEWLTYAEELMDSAELLWDKNDQSIRVEVSGPGSPQNGIVPQNIKKVSGISRTYFLLVGFSIENLLKGFIVNNDPSTITDGKLKKIKSHKIISLVENISDIELSVKEKEICTKIEEAIPYWGRYPIPLEYNNLAPDIGVTEEIRNTILSLFNRLSKKLHDKLIDGWESGRGEKVMSYKNARYGDIIDPKEPLL